MADYRALFGAPPELEEYLGKQTTANLNEIEFFKNTITPDVAQRVADISRNYPNMNPKLAMYAGMFGVEADSPLALELAKRNNEVYIKQNVAKTQNVNKLKRATQLGSLLLDIGFQPISRNFKSTVVAAQKTDMNVAQAVAGNLAIGGLTGVASFIPGVDGDKAADRIRKTLYGDKFANAYKDTKDSYGPTEFNQAWDEIKAGRPLNLGQGYFANSTPIEETQGYRDLRRQGYSEESSYAQSVQKYGRPITIDYEKQENQFKARTRVAGDVDISPGRFVAGQFFSKEDMGYALGSAVIDGTFRIFGDPVNYGLNWLSGAKVGLRSMVTADEQALFKTGKALAEAADNLPLLPRLYKTIAGGKITLPNGTVEAITAKEARRLQFGRTAAQVLETKRGQKLLQAMADTKGDAGMAALMDIPEFRKIDPRILRLFNSIDNAEDMKTVLTSLLNNGNLAGMDDALRIRFGITDEIVQVLTEGKATGLRLPIKPNLIPETANILAKKLTGEYTDIAPLRIGISKLRAAFDPKAQDDVFSGIIGINGELRNALPYRIRKYFDLAPGKYASMKEIGETARNIDGIMKSGRLNLEQRGKYLKQIMDAQNTEDIGEVIRNIYQDIVPEIIKKNPDLKEEEIFLKEVMTFLADESIDIKKYFVSETGQPLAFPGTKFRTYVDKKGKTVYEATPTAQMLSEFAENYISLIDYQELEKAFPAIRKIIGKKGSKLRDYLKQDTVDISDAVLRRLGLKKTGFKTSVRTGKPSIGGGGASETFDYLYQEYLMQRVLKPVWMLRGALTTRVAPEEALRVIMSGSRGSLAHPFQYIALKWAGGEVLDYKNVNNDTLWATRILKKEKEFVEGFLGKDFVQAASAEYPQIEKIMKNLRVGINEEGMASDDFVSWILKNNEDGRDFIFNDYRDMKLTPLKSNKGKVFVDGASDAILNNKAGGSFNINTGTDTGKVFSSVSPYKKLGDVFDEQQIKQIAETNNLTEKEAIQKVINEYLNPDTELGQMRLNYLRKENHSLGWRSEGGALFLDVSVNIPALSKTATVKELEKALVNTALLGIKGLQKSAYISPEAIALMYSSKMFKQADLKYWFKAVKEFTDPRTGKITMGQMDFINPSSPKFAKDVLANVSKDDVIVQQIFNALYDTNFDVAKVIKRGKRGIANLAPDGSWLPTTESYLSAMASKALKNFVNPEFRTQYKGLYKMYKKEVNGVLQEEWKRSLAHQFILHFQNPVSIYLANNGVDETVRYLLYKPEGRALLEQMVKLSDARGHLAKAELFDPVQLRNNVEALGYRMAKLIGGKAVIKNPLTGDIVTEQWATKVRWYQGNKMYPLYEFDLTTGSKMGQKLYKSGGFYNGKDYSEYWQLAVNNSKATRQVSRGGGAIAQSTRLKKFYADFWDLLSPDKAILQDDIAGSFAFLDNIADYALSESGGALIKAKYDKMLESLYTLFLTGPSDLLNRDPLYRISLYEHGLEGLKLFDESTAMEWIRGAERALRGSKFGDTLINDYLNEVDKLKQINGFANEITSMEQAMGIMQKKAASSVVDLLYSTSQRHVFSDMLSSYVPFPEIGAEVWKTWGKLFADQPVKFNRARIAFDAGEGGKPYDSDTGYFFKDPVTGKRMFSYPDPFGLIQKGFFGENLEEQGIRVRPAGFLGALNLVTANGLLPGVGPKVVWTLEFFDAVVKSLPATISKVLLGDFRTDIKDPEEFVLQFIQPSVQKFFTQERFTDNSTEKYDQAYAGSVIDTLGAMYAKGLIDPLDEDKAAEQFDMFSEAANNQWLIRGLAQWSLPTAIQPRIELQDKNGDWWFTQTLAKEYQRMAIENNYDYQATTSEFIDRFGINPIPLTSSKYKPSVKTPYTESAVEFWTKPENNEVMKAYPRTAYFIRPDTIDDKWVWSDDFNALREYYTEDQWDLLMRQTLIEAELQNYKKELQSYAEANKKTTVWINGNYALKRRELEEKSGVLAFTSLGIGEVRSDPKLAIEELYDWEKNDILRNSPEFEPLSLYLAERKKAEDVLINGGEWRGGRFSATTPTIYPLDSTTDRAAFVRDQLKEIGMQLINDYSDTYFNQIFYSILFYEVDNTRKMNK